MESGPRVETRPRVELPTMVIKFAAASIIGLGLGVLVVLFALLLRVVF